MNPDHLAFFEFCGKVVAKAVADDQRIDAYFSRSIYKHILGKPVSWTDMEVEDPDYFRQLQWILQNDLRTEEAAAVSAHISFTFDQDEFGRVRTVELLPGGAKQPLTEDNKGEYVQLLCEYKLTTMIKPQLSAFLKGFHEVLPVSQMGDLFDDKELELLISGLPHIDIEDLKSNTDYVNYQAQSPQIVWLWRALSTDFSKEQLAWFLQFVTGSSQVPLEGFRALVGMRGPQKFSIHRSYGSDRLPTAHTCFNQLDLPEYSSYEVLVQKLKQAVSEGHEGFGFV